MVDITPSNALLAALSNQFAAARQGQTPGVGSAIPGLPGVASSESAPSVSGASLAGGIPATATTGQSVANSLLGGVGGTGDAIAQQVAGTLLSQREPGERGDLGAGVTGGDVGALLSILGGPAALFSIIPSLVASDAAGLPLDPSLLSATTLAELVSGTEDSSPGFSGEFGGALNADGSFTPAISSTGGGGTANIIRRGVIGGSRGVFGGRQESEIDRGRSGPSLSRERTTGRVAGPV